jgi:DNA polymerase
VQAVPDAADRLYPAPLGLLARQLGNTNIVERKVGITKVRGQVFRLKEFALFPLLHPAAALHQGGMLEPLRQDFKKLKDFLDRQAAVQQGPTESSIQTPQACGQSAAPHIQMDLFG